MWWWLTETGLEGLRRISSKAEEYGECAQKNRGMKETHEGQERRLHLRNDQALAVVMARVCLIAVEWWSSTTKTTFRFRMMPWNKEFLFRAEIANIIEPSDDWKKQKQSSVPWSGKRWQ